MVTNSAGAVVQWNANHPYGEEWQVSPAGMPDIDRHRFTGKETDRGTGLSYFGARYYDPEVGRFTTQDTYTYLPDDERIIFNKGNSLQIMQEGFINSQRYNRYAYCLDSPLIYIDNSGNEATMTVVNMNIVNSYIQGAENKGRNVKTGAAIVGLGGTVVATTCAILAITGVGAPIAAIIGGCFFAGFGTGVTIGQNNRANELAELKFVAETAKNGGSYVVTDTKNSAGEIKVIATDALGETYVRWLTPASIGVLNAASEPTDDEDSK